MKVKDFIHKVYVLFLNLIYKLCRQNPKPHQTALGTHKIQISLAKT